MRSEAGLPTSKDDAMRIVYEDSVVAFLDVLGFGRVVSSSTAGATALLKLEGLVDLLHAAMPGFNTTVAPSVPPVAIPQFIVASDTLLISAPLLTTRSGLSYDGLTTVVMRCIQVAQLFLRSGYLLRGGIAAGPLHFQPTATVSAGVSGAVVLGPAYLEAYSLEVRTKRPRIELSPRTAELWRTGPMGRDSHMCLLDGRRLIVNVFEGAYLENNNWSEAYDELAKIIAAGLAAGPNCNSRVKWRWTRKRLNQYRAQIGA